MNKKLTDLNEILTQSDKEFFNTNQKNKKTNYVYVKDIEGYVTKKSKKELQESDTIITKKEWEEKSGENYYKETFGRGGKRKGAGRKPVNGVVLKFQIRVSEKEKEFINFARSHNLNYDDLMQG